MKTLSAVSEEFNIPISTLQKAVRNGRLPARKFGRDWIIETDNPEFKQWLENYRPKGTKK
jgi:hypothetical protein